jgi:Cys-tRNA synthase (O-phospho-L-seryl-tRNA:Cys-tRNA synthase)
VLLQQNQAAVLLDEVVTGLGKKVALGLLATTPAEKRNNAAKANGKRVAKIRAKKAHCLLMGLAYAVPSVLPIRSTLTRQGAPVVFSGTTNGMGVKAGIGVLALVATAPTPT